MIRTVVIGAGVVGASVAYRLAQAGASVTVLEATRVGGGTSGISFAWTNANNKPPRPYHELNVAGMKAHAALREEFGAIPWWHPGGSIEWEAEADHPAQQEKIARLREWGYKAEWLTPKQLAELEPDIDPALAGDAPIAYFPEEGWLDPVLYAADMIGAARRLGATLHIGARVQEIETRGGRVVGVKTLDGRSFPAEQVVNCAGRWANDASPDTGLHIPLAPTVGFLGALLMIAEGCRRDGLFEAVGGFMARGSEGNPRRLLALVFGVASAVTIVLGLDATVVLLTPVVLATATRLRTGAKASLYACAHLANSASLLLPVSNLTNLLAFRASGLSFTRFAGLMLLPTLAAVSIDWIVLSRWLPEGRARRRRLPAVEAGVDAGSTVPSPEAAPPRLPRFAVAVLGLTLVGFALSSPLGVQPIWFAVAGALAVNAPALGARRTTARVLLGAVEPGFLVFVLGLGVIVAAASGHGLSSAVASLLPGGDSLADLMLIAAVSAVLANLVNNLPATLIVVPVAVSLGPGAVLATLIGVNVGPNLTHVGSLATLLWRRVLQSEGVEFELREFLVLGALTVPPALVAATALLWVGLRI